MKLVLKYNWHWVITVPLLSSFTPPSPYGKTVQHNGIALDIKTEHCLNRRTITRELKALWGRGNSYYNYFFIPVHNPVSLHVWTPQAKTATPQPLSNTPPHPYTYPKIPPYTYTHTHTSFPDGNSERSPPLWRHLLSCHPLTFSYLYVVLLLLLNCKLLEGSNPVSSQNAWNTA